MRHAFVVAGVLLCGPRLSAQSVRGCERLMDVALPNTMISSAQTISAGTFTPSALRLRHRIPPEQSPGILSRDRDTEADHRLGYQDRSMASPTERNGKLQSVGNGAWRGVLPYPALGGALARGYATAGTAPVIPETRRPLLLGILRSSQTMAIAPFMR